MPPSAVSPSLSPTTTTTKPPPRVLSPGPMSLRHRGPTRSATFAEGSSPSLPLQNQRRNSTLSDSVSEARNSIRSSTDDLFFPRAAKQGHGHAPTEEESHWHSAPLGLALLPAIAGVFFQNGSSVVTDVTLLVLAAIFLNWSVRLPWDWYRSAQAVRQPVRYYDATELPPQLDIDDDDDESSTALDPREESAASPDPKRKQRASNAASAATRELQIHELAALASCFIFPIIGTWILHTIRSKLSRPSEGLVSNYNLTIFLLASEIRPFSHLLKMVQARTLHLQRVVASSSEDEQDRIDPSRIMDITKRLEELEAHVAESAAARLSSSQDQPSQQDKDNAQTLVSQTSAEVRKSFQAELDALTRAVRRYEKRTAATSFHTDSKLQALEAHVLDAVNMATTAHRSVTHPPRGIVLSWLDRIYAIALLPLQICMSLISLPVRLARRCLHSCKALVVSTPSKPPRKSPRDRTSQTRRSKRVQNDQLDVQGLKPIREHK